MRSLTTVTKIKGYAWKEKKARNRKCFGKEIKSERFERPRRSKRERKKYCAKMGTIKRNIIHFC